MEIWPLKNTHRDLNCCSDNDDVPLRALPALRAVSKPLSLELLSCIRVCFLMKCHETKNKYSGCFYLKPRTEGMERVGWQPDLPNASVCKGRWRANERGQLFSGHAKEEGAALVTWHTVCQSPWQTRPVPFKCQQAAVSTNTSVSQLFVWISANNKRALTYLWSWTNAGSLLRPMLLVLGMLLAFIGASSGNTQSIWSMPGWVGLPFINTPL